MLQKQDQIQYKIQNQDILQQDSNQKRSKISQFLNDYQSYMQSSQKIYKKDLLKLIREGGVKYFQSQFAQNLQIRMVGLTPNFQILQFQAKYGSFSMILSLLNLETNSYIHNISQVSSGSFGNVFKTSIREQNVAIKCLQFTTENFSVVLKNTITEFFFLKIASIIGSGPLLLKSFGFDLLINQNCIQFAMQICQPIERMKQSRQIQTQLKTCLKKLHLLHIIHHDVKTDNMCYSYQQDRYIMIDYGLSKIVKEKIGFKTFTRFRGSILYCSAEMQQQYLNQTLQFIDVYFNDSQGLRKSFQSLQKERIYQQQVSENLVLLDTSQRYQLIYLKFCLYRIEINPTLLLKYIERQGEKIIQQNSMDILQFVALLPSTQNLHNFVSRYIPSTYNDEKHKLNKKFLCQLQDTIDSENINAPFGQVYHHLTTIIERTLVQDPINEPKQRENKLLMLTRNASNHQKQIYYLKVANFIRLDCGNRSFSERLNVAQIFISYQNISELYVELKSPIKKVVLFLLKYSLTFPTSNYKLNIIDMLAVSVLFLEVLPQVELISIFKDICTLDATFYARMKTLFKFFVSLKWVSQKYRSNYSYQALLQSFCNLFCDYLSKQTCSEELELNSRQILMEVIKQKLSKSSLQIIFNIIQSQKFKKIALDDLDFAKEIGLYLNTRAIEQNLQVAQSRHQTALKSLQHMSRDHVFQKYNFLYSNFTLSFTYKQTQNSSSFLYLYKKFQKNYERYQEFKHFKLFISYQIFLFQSEKIDSKTLINEVKGIALSSDSYLKASLSFDLICSQLILGKRTNSQLLSFIYQNLQNIIDFPQKNYPSSDKPIVHKHHTFYSHSLRILQYLFNFSKNRAEILDKMKKFAKQSQLFVSYQLCILCKVRSLTTIHIIKAFILRMDSQILQAILLYSQLITLHLKISEMKNEIFDLIILIINVCQQTQNFSICKQLVVFLDEKVKEFQYQEIYLLQNNSHLLKMVYLYLFSHEDSIKLITFIDRIIEILYMKFNKKESQIFYKTIRSILNHIPMQTERRNFYDNHIDIVDHFISFGPHLKPYISLIFIILLEFDFDKEKSLAIFKFISQSLIFIDSKSKNLILSQYFKLYLSFYETKYRKQFYLTKLHLKNCDSEKNKLLSLMNANKRNMQLSRSDERRIKITKKVKKYFDQL